MNSSLATYLITALPPPRSPLYSSGYRSPLSCSSTRAYCRSVPCVFSHSLPLPSLPRTCHSGHFYSALCGPGSAPLNHLSIHSVLRSVPAVCWVFGVRLPLLGALCVLRQWLHAIRHSSRLGVMLSVLVSFPALGSFLYSVRRSQYIFHHCVYIKTNISQFVRFPPHILSSLCKILTCCASQFIYCVDPGACSDCPSRRRSAHVRSGAPMSCDYWVMPLTSPFLFPTSLL